MLKSPVLYIFLLLISLNISAQEQTDTLFRADQPSKVVRTRINRDTIIPETHITSWIYSRTFQKIEVPFDTAQINFVYIEPVKESNIFNISLGGIGQPILYAEFDKRIKNNLLHWSVQCFKPYIVTHRDVAVYNTKSPYTRLYYVGGSNKYQQFHFVHTQNVNRNINLGLKYNIYSTEGFLLSQMARNRLGSFWFDIQNYRYRNFTTVNFHTIKVDNNGGIVDGSYIFDSTGVELRRVPTRLTNAGNDIYLFNGLMNHEFAILRGDERIAFLEAGVKHEMMYYRTRRKYYDPSKTTYLDITNTEVDFFTNRFNKKGSSDTLSVREMTNNAGLFANIGKNKNLQISALVKNRRELYNNYYSDTLFEYNNDTIIKTFYSTYRLSGNFFKNRLTFSFETSSSIGKGYRKEDNSAYFEINYRHRLFSDTATASLSAERNKTTPDYFLQNYYSNHYKWQNRWSPQEHFGIGFQWSLPKHQIYFLVKSNIIKNYLWVDNQREWNIYSDNLDVLGVGVEKTQKIWKYFSIRAKLLYQETNDTIIDIPKFAVSTTLLFNTPLNFKSTGGHANLNVGIDCWFNTHYYLPDFDPALNQYFMQREKRYGNYPLVDIFASAHIKRLVLFVRFEHLTSIVTKTTYLNAFNYPIRPFNVKFGVSWTFYD